MMTNNTLNTWIGIQASDISWMPILTSTITFESQYKVVPTEGYLAWEYNPLRNYRLSQNMYEKDGKYYTENELIATLTSIGGKEFSLYDKQTRTPLKDGDIREKFG
jgi:hypothetical protein